MWLAATVAHAEPPSEAVWQAMKERSVVVERNDGTLVAGKLVGVDPTTVVVLTRTGEPVAVPRSAVRALRGEATDTPAVPTAPVTPVTPVTPTTPGAPSTPSTPPSSSAPGAASATPSSVPPTLAPGPVGEGAVAVHIDANEPDVKLYRVTSQSEYLIAGRVGAAVQFELVCKAPCDRSVDGSRGESFFLTAGGMRIGPAFQLMDTDHTGKIRLGADVRSLPSPRMLWGGVVVLGVSGTLFISSAIMAAAQVIDEARTPWYAALGGSGVGMIAGLIMAVKSRGDYDVQVPQEPAGVRLRGVGFIPPVVVGATRLPLSGALSFSF